MQVPVFLLQLAVLVIFVISAYRVLSFAKYKSWPDCFYNISVAIVSFAYLFNHL